MTSIRSLKKGDWFSFSVIEEVKNEDVKDCLNNYKSFIIGKRDLVGYFMTDKKIVYGKNRKFDENRNKYWFEITEDEIYEEKIISKKELIEWYEDGMIEVHKIKTKDDTYWKDYERSKRDYNWKYDIARDINLGWVYCKRKLMKEYLEDLEIARKSKNSMTIKFAEEAVNNLIDGLTQEMKSKSTFCQGSFGGGIDIPRNLLYFDAMLKHYLQLNVKYKNKIDSDIYAMLMDFEKVVLCAKMYYLSQSDIEIVTMMMEGNSDIGYLTGYINANYGKQFKKPLTEHNLKFRIDEEIPKMLLKAYDRLNKDDGKAATVDGSLEPVMS